MKRRDRLQVIYDILKAINERNGTIRTTHILYKSNLSRKLLIEYLNDLIAGDFIEQHEGKVITYSLKPKGFEFLKRYSGMAEFISFFGA